MTQPLFFNFIKALIRQLPLMVIAPLLISCQLSVKIFDTQSSDKKSTNAGGGPSGGGGGGGNSGGSGIVVAANSIFPTYQKADYHLYTEYLQVIGTKTFYVKEVIGGHELWVNDSSDSSQTKLLTGVFELEVKMPNKLEVFQGKVVFVMTVVGIKSLWISDGTMGGTVVLRGLLDAGYLGCTTGIVADANRFFYVGELDGVSGECELIESNGTAVGTNQVVISGNPKVGGIVKIHNGHLLFLASHTSSDSLFDIWSYPLPPEVGSITRLTSVGGDWDVQRIFSPGMVEIGSDIYLPYKGVHRISGITGATLSGVGSVIMLAKVGSTLVFQEQTGSSRIYKWNGSSKIQIGSLPMANYTTFNNRMRLIAEVNGWVYFASSDSSEFSSALFRTDGNTVESITSGLTENPFFGSFGNNIIFVADRANGYGTELYSYNTLTSTIALIRDFEPGAGHGFYAWFHNIKNRPSAVLPVGLVFSPDGGPDQGELWITDGTSLGTHPLASINPGASTLSQIWYYDYNNPLFGKVIGGKLYFQGYDPIKGNNVYSSDGSEPSLVQITASETVMSFQSFSNLIFSAGKIFFLNTTEDAGEELWVYDGGTAAHQVIDLIPGGYGGRIGGIVPFKTGVLFDCYNELGSPMLYFSDGTAVGTIKLHDNVDPNSNDVTDIVAGPNNAYFLSSQPGTGFEIFKTDGTPGGTGMVEENDIGPNDSFDWYMEPAIHGDTLFALSYYTNPTISDGTALGTFMLTPLVGSNFDYPYSSYTAAGKFFFFGDIDNDSSYEIISFNFDGSGLAAVTSLTPTHWVASNDHEGLFWTDDPVDGWVLKSTNGAPGGTINAFDPDPGNLNSNFWNSDEYGIDGTFNLPGKTAFTYDTGSGDDLYLWDRAILLSTKLNPAGVSIESKFYKYGSHWYFLASDAAHGKEVWKTDGTPGGTQLAFELEAGAADKNPQLHGILGSKLLISDQTNPITNLGLYEIP